MRLPFATLITLCAALVAGCVGFNPKSVRPGLNEAQVLAAMGTPTGRYAMPGGANRLEYARGPAGKETWMVDLDASGRVTANAQVLVEANFDQVRNGTTRDELLRLLGRPSDVARERGGRETLSWRYENLYCDWFRVTVDATGRVMGKGSYLQDPDCYMFKS